jgi:hypothetical protein
MRSSFPPIAPTRYICLLDYCVYALIINCQVANLANCIKIAMDFVSDVEVARCFELAEERRRLEPDTHIKEDMLRIKEMLWYTYVYLRQCKSFEPVDKDAKLDEKERARNSQHRENQRLAKKAKTGDEAASNVMRDDE